MMAEYFCESRPCKEYCLHRTCKGTVRQQLRHSRKGVSELPGEARRLKCENKLDTDSVKHRQDTGRNFSSFLVHGSSSGR